MTLSGVKTVKNILITFMLIGVMTGLWRAAGTIPVIVCYATELVRPSVFLVMAFLMNCLVSVLTGTAFGTAATMGVITATMGAAMGVAPAFIGGVVLSGAYFGDRFSPVSTSALLVANLTGTSVFGNLKNMARTGAIPFLITCGIYAVLGVATSPTGTMPDLWALFGRQFILSPLALLPAAVILVLAACRVNVKLAMLASILTALPICLGVQGAALAELPTIMVTGYEAMDAEVAVMMNGGGALSMLNVSAVVCLSASYSGIFQKTGLLNPMRSVVQRMAAQTTRYAAMLFTSVLTVLITCNQTLSIMLSRQLCEALYEDGEAQAIDMEDTAVVVAPLVPWAIAHAVSLAAVGAPSVSALFACFLYVLPLCRLAKSLKGRSR